MLKYYWCDKKKENGKVVNYNLWFKLW